MMQAQKRSGHSLTEAWIGPEDTAWRTYLEQSSHDFYHLPGYVALTAKRSDAKPIAYIAQAGDASLFVPLHLRDLPDDLGAASGLKDAVSPYGYPTPLLMAGEGERAAHGAELLSAFVEAARAAGIVTIFLRLHPYLTLPEAALRAAGTLIEHGPTVTIDLSRPDKFWTETRNGHRLNIRKLEKAGFEARFDHWDAFDDFIEIYRLTMKHVNATEDYFFDRSYFQDLHETLGESLHLCTIHAPDGQVAAGAVQTEVDGLVQGHLAGTHPAFRKRAPATFLIHSIRQWAAEQGYRWYHLGGGLGASKDSLFAFKTGFTKGRRAFRSLRIIVDPKRNAELNRTWTTRHAPDASLEDQTSGSFFPAYRRRPDPVISTAA